MATAEEILAGMTAEETQQVLVIDNDLRRIAIPEGVRLLGVTSDDDVLRLRFTMPRVYGEVDLSGFAIRINYLNAGSEGDVYPVDDAQTDGDVIRFTWLVGRHACKFAGDVRFIVCLKRSDGGEVAQEYNTTLATLPVLEGLETGEAVAQAHPDVIEAILRRLDTLEQEGGGVTQEAIAAAVAAYIQEHGVPFEETDPTVPAWAKQPSKPTYTAGEVGARPDTWTPSASDVGARPDTWTPSASDVGARPDTWMPSAADVGADAAGTAAAQVGAHNASGEAHADLRALIEGLTSRLNALADSDDTTLDQLSEIVAYIKSNKALIDAVTTGKVSTSDIVDNLTTNESGKVLSAAQGVALKAMIDGIVIPTALPNPQPITINGQRYDGSEAVEVSVTGEGSGVEVDATLTQSGKAADAKAVGDNLAELNQANAQQDEVIATKANDADLAAVAKSGSYTDLTNKPTIPTVPTTLPNPNKLILSGAVTAEYDGSAEVSVEIPAGGGYNLPVASATQLGGVMPAAKTDEMTQAVGVDAEGKLFTAAGAGGGETLTAENTLLAGCVIPSGTAQWTNTQTGLTVGNLREYKIFGVILETSSSFLSGMYLGSTRIYYESGTKLRLLFEWLDSDKRAVHIANGVNGSGYGTHPFVSTSAIQAQGLTMGGAGLQIIQSGDHDDAAVTVYNHEALTADATVKIYGVIKG